MRERAITGLLLGVLVACTSTSDGTVIPDGVESAVSFDVALASPDEWTTPASQTFEEAIRDGVPPRMALVPTEDRVGSDSDSIDIPDGRRWIDGPGLDDSQDSGVLASANPGWWETDLAGVCTEGFLCGRVYYSEFLLVDGEGDIVLAHAMPLIGSGAGFARLAPDGSGDLIRADGPSDITGATVIARLGTTFGDRDVLVYPSTDNSPFVTTDVDVPLAPPGEPVVLPDGWTVLEPGTPAPDIEDHDRVLEALGY